MLYDVFDFIMICMAVAAISTTVTRSSMPLFRPLRRWALFRCPYCLAHWVAIPLCIPNNLQGFVIQWFAIVAGSCGPGWVIEQYLKEIEYGPPA
jgi:hypothetical protein